MKIKYETFIGSEIAHLIDRLSDMRIRTFKDYPYLYAGEQKKEKKYLKEYSKNPKSTLVIAKDGHKIVGMSTGMPFSSEADILKNCQNVLRNMRLNINESYYLGEILVEKPYRKKGVSHQLYKAHMGLIRNMMYRHLFMLTVIREKTCSLFSDKIKDISMLWPRLGFKKTPVTVEYEWPTIQADGNVVEKGHLMQLWHKELN